MKTLRLFISLLFITAVGFALSSTPKKAPLIGESENVYTLADENQDIRGLAFDDVSGDTPRLFVLDRCGKIFVYRWHQDLQRGKDELEYLEVYELPKDVDDVPIANPRGLAFTLDERENIFYFLNWDDSEKEVKSQLWRYNVSDGTASTVSLSLYTFRVGDRELLDIAYENGNIFVSFDATGYKDRNLRVQRGIIRLAWNQAYDRKLEFIRHIPDSGYLPSRGLASMDFEGARYLWGTVGCDYIYCADAQTGRGLFHFDRARSAEEDHPYWGLAFGKEALWVSESVSGADRVHRVNVTKNLDAFYEGSHIFRHLIMTIKTEPERDTSSNPGKVYHYYSRPYTYDQLHNQGVWPKTEKISDVSGSANATIKNFTYDPADDISSRQYMSLVEYADASARTYSSQYEIDIWTNAYRKYVYPHRVDKNRGALKGTDYLADDPELFNLTDTKTYGSFFKRVKDHIEEKYGVPADMDNPYWAARNALEYIQDHYYYPGRSKRKPAAVDYDRHHYDANPGNLKIELSSRDYDKSQIIACSGTSVMLAGAMRYLGIPARWMGTGTEKLPEVWDANRNGLLDEEETAVCSNGHRYSQVWLGSHYGWICFDGTPTRPDFNDYDPPPPIRSQWRYMNRAAAGHLKDKRIVFNVGSKLFRPLYRDFEYDEKLAVDNNCGGDQRYNLQGRFDKPELWELARQNISVKNVCFIRDVTVSGPKDETKLAWTLKGDWQNDPKARVSIFLQQIDPETNKAKDVARLAKGIPSDSGSALLNFSDYKGKNFRIIIRKDGDPETGGCSDPFDLE